MHPAGQRGIKLRGCGAAVSMGRRVCGNDFVMLKKLMLYISSCPTCPSTRGWTNKWEGKDKHWETLRFSLFFWSSPKTKIRKKQKTSKANFQCSKCCLVLAVFCELWKLSLQAVRAVWCDRRVTVLGCVSHDKNNSICIHKNSSMQQRMCTLFSQIARPWCCSK